MMGEDASLYIPAPIGEMFASNVHPVMMGDDLEFTIPPPWKVDKLPVNVQLETLGEESQFFIPTVLLLNIQLSTKGDDASLNIAVAGLSSKVQSITVGVDVA